MLDFAAIDFETANSNPSSVCSVGLVVVRGGAITDRLYHLIRPTPNYYQYWNTRVHGLTARDTAAADPFPAVWARLAPAVEGLTLVAHNAGFDRRCLEAAFAAYGMAPAGYRFLCTCVAARRVFGDSLPNHRLPTVAERCGYNLATHHHALADAEACAWIAREIL